MKKKKGGKSSIVKDVMAQGFTARKAQKAVNAVVDLMTFALWCGEPVEIPGGTIQSKIRKGRPRTEFQKFRNMEKDKGKQKKIAFRIVRYPGRRRAVKFTPDPKLDLTPLPPPAVPETAEQVEARQLASELLGRPAGKSIVTALQAAVAIHAFRPGALLRRLRDFRDRGWRFTDLEELAREVSKCYWL
jgi:nucleoid DNA-binding protein